MLTLESLHTLVCPSTLIIHDHKLGKANNVLNVSFLNSLSNSGLFTIIYQIQVDKEPSIIDSFISCVAICRATYGILLRLW